MNSDSKAVVGQGGFGAQPAAFDEILLLVGRLNYTWTNTESLLLHLIAGLSGTTKDVAVVIFLTLNTTRARVDLVERLAKMPHQAKAERDAVLRHDETVWCAQPLQPLHLCFRPRWRAAQIHPDADCRSQRRDPYGPDH